MATCRNGAFMQISDQVSKPFMSARISWNGAKATGGDFRLSRLDCRLLDVEYVDHAQVDAAHFALVVVYQADAAGRVGRVDGHFLLDFAAHAFFIWIAAVGRGVAGRDMAADADAVLAAEIAPRHCPLPRVYCNTVWRPWPSSGGRSRKESVV